MLKNKLRKKVRKKNVAEGMVEAHHASDLMAADRSQVKGHFLNLIK